MENSGKTGEFLEKSAILEAIEKSFGNVALAARMLSTPAGQVRARIKADPELSAAVEEARVAVADAAETQLRAAVNNREEWAIKYALARARSASIAPSPSAPPFPPAKKPRPAKLTKAQRVALVAWAAEGLRLSEINQRAAEFDPPFEVEWLQLKHVRARQDKAFGELRENFEKEAMQEGLARKAVRIRELAALYDQHMALIKARGEEMAGEVAGGASGLTARDYKGKDADRAVYKYDGALIKEMRGLLDDIAKELGDRKTNVDLTTGGELILKVQYGNDGSQGIND